MAKPRTAVQLVAVLDGELSWRRADLLFVLRLVERTSGLDQVSAIRAAVPLLYAHWEGFIKRASGHYADHLSAQRLYFRDVQVCLSGLKAQSHVAVLVDIKKRVFAASETLQNIREIENERVAIDLGSRIDRMGNLSHEMLMQIVQFFGLPAATYEAYKGLIDDALLFHRNKIAHGEYLDVDAERYKSLHRDIVTLVERFKDDIEDAATMKSYRRAA